MKQMKVKKMMIYQLILILTLSLVIPFQQASAAPLSDIPGSSQAEINYLMDRKIVGGYADGTFKPQNKVTREEVAKMIGVALNLNGAQRETVFPDVNPNSFGSGYIASAVEAEIITGHTDGKFRPKDYVTRGHSAIMLERAFQQLKGKELAVFTDVPFTDKNLYAAVDGLFSNGITVGAGKGLFKSDEEITRVEFSLLLARTLEPKFRRTVAANESTVKVTGADTLNVRSGPGVSHEVVGTLKDGEKILIANSPDTWQYMRSESYTGYVHRNYLVDADGNSMAEAEVANRYIAIDAGHGGSDPGSIGNGLLEKNVTLAVAKKVEKALEKQNVKVLMTRANDTFVGLQDRVRMAENARVDTFVSIHANAFKDSSANGTETYYRLAKASTKTSDSKQLATFIQKRLHKALDTKDRGVKTANFAVLRTTFPSTLVELAFITNKQEAQKLGSEQYQQLAADAITAGIMDYYKWKGK